MNLLREKESYDNLPPLISKNHAPLARISHQLPTAAAYLGASTALRSFGRLDILSRLPAGPSEVYIFTVGAKRQAPYPPAPPRYGTCSENRGSLGARASSPAVVFKNRAINNNATEAVGIGLILRARRLMPHTFCS
jgi:hypothetical protein